MLSIFIVFVVAIMQISVVQVEKIKDKRIAAECKLTELALYNAEQERKRQEYIASIYADIQEEEERKVRRASSLKREELVEEPTYNETPLVKGQIMGFALADITVGQVLSQAYGLQV